MTRRLRLASSIQTAEFFVLGRRSLATYGPSAALRHHEPPGETGHSRTIGAVRHDRAGGIPEADRSRLLGVERLDMTIIENCVDAALIVHSFVWFADRVVAVGVAEARSASVSLATHPGLMSVSVGGAELRFSGATSCRTGGRAASGTRRGTGGRAASGTRRCAPWSSTTRSG